MKLSYLKTGFLAVLIFFTSASWAQMKKISGKVTQENGSPLESVTVAIKGKEPVAITNATGDYEVDVAAGSTLVFTFTGFDPVEKKVDKSSIIDVVMEPHQAKMDEVVIVGYGTQKRSQITELSGQ